MDINECIDKGYLTKINPADDLIRKEFNEAEYDLGKARIALKSKDYKWCIVKSYYCIFHSASAVLFKLGLREKRHFAIGVVLEDLNKKGKLESKYVDYFSAAISSREGADYHYVYSQEIAEHNLEIAEEFIIRMKKFVGKLN